MASVMKKYPISAGRVKRAAMEGFTLTGGGTLVSEEEGRRVLFLGCLDSGQPDCPWGRFRFKAELTGDAIPIVRAFASNEMDFAGGQSPFSPGQEGLIEEKLRHFELAGCSRFMAAADMLLYSQNGRYLWLCVEVAGAGTAVLSDFEVFSPRDNFLSTFPEIYRENADFFHRYLSIFSSVYYDIQEVIDGLDRYVDVDKTPYEALPVLAGWLGLEMDGGFLDETALRALVKSAFHLLRRKGTREAVEGILKIFVSEPFYIIEQRTAMENLNGEARRIAEKLYGESPFGLTVLLLRPADERLHAELTFLLRQFILLRGRLNLVFPTPDSRLDSYGYMDINARIANPRAGTLDSVSILDGLTTID
ncbi:MAG: phage tail protein [Oscillospiraceae bacterium]|nr:phage tail protein [Oscillospiraceae bacterium]